VTADFTLCASMAATRGAAANSATEIEEWAERLERCLARVDVYATSTNDWDGLRVEEALYLKGADRRRTREADAGLLALANARVPGLTSVAQRRERGGR